jgi:single-stranded DNA-binding protein
MSRNSITLVGRATALEFREFESGAAMASFTLTIKPRGEQPPLVVRCEGYGKRTAEQFEQIDEGSLVGIIGSMTQGAVGALPLVRIDRLELLGQPVAAVEG